MPCKRCNAKEAHNYGVAIYDDDPDSRDEGVHIADWELTLCDDCVETLEKKLEVFLSLVDH